MSSARPLRLRATDAEDLAVIAAVLQDSVIAVSEMKYLAAEHRFVFVANRFRWEDAGRERSAEGTPIYERVHAGVAFENVAAVRQTGLDRSRRNQVLSLLTIELGDGGIVDLTFSAGVAVRLEVDRVLCHLEDFGEPWPTQRRPIHPFGNGE
jgi:hypothetical protein